MWPYFIIDENLSHRYFIKQIQNITGLKYKMLKSMRVFFFIIVENKGVIWKITYWLKWNFPHVRFPLEVVQTVVSLVEIKPVDVGISDGPGPSHRSKAVLTSSGPLPLKSPPWNTIHVVGPIIVLHVTLRGFRPSVLPLLCSRLF